MKNNKNNECKCESPISVGGQALIEGIMMMGPKGAAMSVRLPDGTIDTEKLEVKHLRDKFKPAGWPLIRGVVNMVESLLFGFKCMEKSAEKDIHHFKFRLEIDGLWTPQLESFIETYLKYYNEGRG